MKKELRLAIYQKYQGRCGYCGQAIDIQDMQVDHMHPKRLDGLDDFENLMPSCRGCNHYKRASTVEGFRRLMLTLHERIEQIYIVRVARNFGLLRIERFSGKFYFELYSNEGDGAPGDPVRPVTTYWAKDGELLACNDPLVTGERDES